MRFNPVRLVAANFLLVVAIAACGSSPSSPPAATAVPVAAPLTAAPASTVAAPLGSTSGQTSGGGCANPYYPVQSGASWSYSSSGGNRGPYTYTSTLSDVSDTGFTENLQYGTGVTYNFKWTCQNGNLSALNAGGSSFTMTTSSAQMNSTTVTSDGYTVPAVFDAGQTWSHTVTVQGIVQSNGKQATSQIMSQSNCSATGTDSITVPAGTFPAAQATCTQKVVVSAIAQGNTMPISSNTENITFWYARGVGFVKSVATGGKNNETIVLTAYKVQ